MSVEQAWLLKGWLMAQDAPQPIMAAIDAVIAASSGVTATPPPVFIPQFSIAEPDEESPPESGQAHEPKKRRAWSPEARAAQAERMRATQARLKEEKNTSPGKSRAPSMGGA